MDPDAVDPYITYVTPVDEKPKVNRHKAFYQRLKQESRERWQRSREKFETLSKSEQEKIKECHRQSSAAYREKHRDELRVKEQRRRQLRKAAIGRSDKS